MDNSDQQNPAYRWEKAAVPTEPSTLREETMVGAASGCVHTGLCAGGGHVQLGTESVSRKRGGCARLCCCDKVDRLMADLRLPGSSRKKSRQVTPAVGKTAGAHKAAVSLDTLHPDAPPGMLFETPSEKIDRGEGGLLRVSRQNAQTCELVHGSILKQARTGAMTQCRGTSFTSTWTRFPGDATCLQAHVQFLRCVLVWMAMGPPGPAAP